MFDEGEEENVFTLPSLSHLLDLDALWEKLSHCLIALADSTDGHAVLVLQPTVEAFFLVHGSEKGQTAQQAGQEKRLERSQSHRRLVTSSSTLCHCRVGENDTWGERERGGGEGEGEGRRGRGERYPCS